MNDLDKIKNAAQELGVTVERRVPKPGELFLVICAGKARLEECWRYDVWINKIIVSHGMGYASYWSDVCWVVTSN